MSRAALALGGVGAAAGLAGAVLGGVALSRVESLPAGGSPTVAVSSASASDSAATHDAAVATCAAVDTFRAAVRAVRQPYIDAVKAAIASNSPEFVALEGRYFGGVAAELDYLSAHTSLDAPRTITDAVVELRKAATELLDADVRSEPGSVSNEALARLRSADDAVAGACDAAGARK